MTNSCIGRAHARVGLLGNPSDGYGGKVLAFTIADFVAEVTLREDDRLRFVPGPSDQLDFDHLGQAYENFGRTGCEDGLRLLKSAVAQFVRHVPAVADPDGDAAARARFSLSYRTEIPRQVGLAGSSAIITAALRALSTWFGVDLPPLTLAKLSLAAERDDLGITAGAMDRIVQAHEGLMAMDFSGPLEDNAYRRLPGHHLPAVLVAWDPAGAEPSGRAHGDLRDRWQRGDPALRATMSELGRLVDTGVGSLLEGDRTRLRALMNRNFDLRTTCFSIRSSDRAVVECVRARGGGAKLCGSGGSIVLVPADDDDVPSLRAAIASVGYACIEARLHDPSQEPGPP